LCAPGGTTCQTIDHVSVDTASFGFRVIASVLNSSLAQALPQTQASSGQPLVECTQFADGYVWGPVKTADLKIGGEEAASVPVQNPVFHFTTDNNGVIVELQSVGAAGAPTASGSLVFGIDTQSNNALGMATVLTVDANVGEFTTQFNTQTANQTLAASIIDSG